MLSDFFYNQHSNISKTVYIVSYVCISLNNQPVMQTYKSLDMHDTTITITRILNVLFHNKLTKGSGQFYR